MLKFINFFSEKQISIANIKLNKELHSEGSDRSCRHIEVELAPNVTYTAGDHLAVYPENNMEVISSWNI